MVMSVMIMTVTNVSMIMTDSSSSSVSSLWTHKMMIHVVIDVVIMIVSVVSIVVVHFSKPMIISLIGMSMSMLCFPRSSLRRHWKLKRPDEKNGKASKLY